MGNGLSLSNFSGADDSGTSRELIQYQGRILNFEDIQSIIHVNVDNFNLAARAVGADRNGSFLLINTLPANQQGCLIPNTVLATDEEARINDIISGRDDDGELVTVVVYGKNATDETVATKCAQLKTLGISNVRAYVGGMFEWLLLQDIYGPELFPTTGKCSDLLEYRSAAALRPGTRKMIQ
jgi:hypothetical protein